MLPGDYSEYKVFLEDVTSDNTEDLTCLRVLPYKISKEELHPETINQITNYLSDKWVTVVEVSSFVKNSLILGVVQRSCTTRS